MQTVSEVLADKAAILERRAQQRQALGNDDPLVCVSP